MGGKKQVNRTKNNARPSSSARSANLLENQPTTYFGFGLGSDKNGPAAFTANDVDSSTGAFQLVLKKMTKKDPTTKMKALQEFCDLCQESDSDAVKVILPYWARLYCQLCGDPDHRVREAAHLGHRAVIANVKKYLAPYLKEIIGPWFTAQFDTHAPSASAAVAAFKEAFSPVKFAEAIAFCQDEILSYYLENLTVHTPQTLSNAKACTSEEVEEKYRRVVTSSLLGYASYLQKLTKDQILACEEGNRKLISSSKFWKLGHNQDPLIRHGFFTVLVSLCEYASWLVENETQKLSGMLFNNLTENDPVVLPVLWDAVLIAAVAVPDCWKYGNVAKQLNQILKSGGKGHATNIFPKILPLLSAIPKEKIGDKEMFLKNLFTNMRAGMAEASVGRSRSESMTVARTFVESLQYFIMLNRDEHPLAEDLVDCHLLGELKSRFLELPPPHGTTMPLFYYVIQLIRSWSKNMACYEQLVSQFWRGIEEIFKTCADSPVFAANADLTVIFMSMLRDTDKFVPRSGKDRVRFSDDEQEEIVPQHSENDLSYETNLQRLSEFLTNLFIEKFKLQNDQLLLTALLELKKIYPSFDNFGSKELCDFFFHLAQRKQSTGFLTELCMTILPHVPDDIGNQLLLTLSNLKDLNCSQFLGILPCECPNVIELIHGENYFSTMYFNLLDDYLLGKCGTEGATALCKYLHPNLYLDKKKYVKLLNRLAWAVNNKRVLHARIKVLIEACNREVCLHPSFINFAVEASVALCNTGTTIFTTLFDFTLRKIKCYWSGDSLWEDLINFMKTRMLQNEWDPKNFLNAVNIFVKVVTDVDLSDTCEASEINDVMLFMKAFLKFPNELQSSGIQLRETILAVREMLGTCSYKYYEMEAVSGNRKARTSHDWNHRDIVCFIQWLEFANLLITELIHAYPVTVRASDMGSIKTIDDDDKSTSDDEYPDELLLDPITNEILEVVRSMGMMRLIWKLPAELDLYAIVAPSQKLSDQWLLFLDATTPSDHANLINLSRQLVKSDALWHEMQSELPPQLRLNETIDLHDVISAYILEFCEPHVQLEQPEQLNKLAIIVGTYSECITMDAWNKLFIEMDKYLKKTNVKGSSMEKLGAISNLFLKIKNYFEQDEENTEFKELSLMWNKVVIKDLWLQLFEKWRECIPSWEPNHETGDEAKSHGSVALHRFCEVIYDGAHFIPKSDYPQLAQECIPLFLSGKVCVQTTAYNIILQIVEDCSQKDTELFRANVTEPIDCDDKWLTSQKMNCKWSLHLFSEVLTTSQNVVEALLSDFKLGASCLIRPFTDAFTYAHGYLLIWSCIYEICALAHFALRFQYANWLKQNGHLWILFDSTIKLMPPHIVHGTSKNEKALFEKQPLSFLEAPCCTWIEKRACFIFRCSLQWVSGAVREWWSELEHLVANLISQIASNHVSPVLISGELKVVQNYSDSAMKITVSYQSREVNAYYTIDDSTVQLGLIVPPNYPLGTIKVESKTQNFVHRTLRVSLFLANRNCSLCDALLLWKSELDKRFEGIEHCHICFSLFYGDNCELPRPTCNTCHKKFHSACLYKWFDTSNKSTCPYCRNPF